MAKVLMIEDETSLLDVYSEFVESEGHTVLKAVDGESGLEMAINGDWDIMFLDIMLPKLDGVELLREMNKKDKLEGRPVIMLTNLDTEQIVGQCMELGAVKHLSKAEITPQSVLSEIAKYTSEEGESGGEQGGGIEIDEEMDAQVAEALGGESDDQSTEEDTQNS